MWSLLLATENKVFTIALALMLLMLAPPTLLRFSGDAPPWLLQA